MFLFELLRWEHRPLLIILLVSLGVGFVLLYQHTDFLTDGERFKIWKYTLTEFRINPIIGNGLAYFHDFFNSAFDKYFVERHAQPHNDFIGVYSAFGLVGVGSLFAVLRQAFKGYQFETAAICSLVLTIVPMMVGFVFHVAATSIVFMVVIVALVDNNNSNLNHRRYA
jgi:O-antigen ligase